MRTYRRKGCCTIRQIVSRFAPPSENDTSLYIRQMRDWTGMSADTELLDWVDYDLLAKAMALKETGADIKPLEVLEVIKKYDIKPWLG